MAGWYCTAGGGGGLKPHKKFVYLNRPPFSGLFDIFRFAPEENLSDLVGGWVGGRAGQNPRKAGVAPPPPPPPHITNQSPERGTVSLLLCQCDVPSPA